MSAVRPTIYQALLDATEPLTFARIKVYFDQPKWAAVAAMLYEMHNRGILERTGQMRHYAYRLTDETRARLSEAGTNDLRRLPRKPATIVERKPSPTSPAIQPAWPAPNPAANLKTSVGLPWNGEEELPPVIGERYADVMHRIGHE